MCQGPGSISTDVYPLLNKELAADWRGHLVKTLWAGLQNEKAVCIMQLAWAQFLVFSYLQCPNRCIRIQYILKWEYWLSGPIPWVCVPQGLEVKCCKAGRVGFFRELLRYTSHRAITAPVEFRLYGFLGSYTGGL